MLSVINLYFQRKDRRPRLRIRVRYEYRTGPPTASGHDAESLRVHDDSQEGLYLLLGDFLREHGLNYPQGTPLVRFALSNEGQRPIYLHSVRLTFYTGFYPFGQRLVLDLTRGMLVSAKFAADAGNVLGQRSGEEHLIELVPGDSVGYKFELIRLAKILKDEGCTDDIQLTLEATDRLGNVHRQSFGVNTDLWAYPDSPL